MEKAIAEAITPMLTSMSTGNPELWAMLAPIYDAAQSSLVTLKDVTFVAGIPRLFSCLWTTRWPC